VDVFPFTGCDTGTLERLKDLLPAVIGYNPALKIRKQKKQRETKACM